MATAIAWAICLIARPSFPSKIAQTESAAGANTVAVAEIKFLAGNYFFTVSSTESPPTIHTISFSLDILLKIGIDNFDGNHYDEQHYYELI